MERDWQLIKKILLQISAAHGKTYFDCVDEILKYHVWLLEDGGFIDHINSCILKMGNLRPGKIKLNLLTNNKHDGMVTALFLYAVPAPSVRFFCF